MTPDQANELREPFPPDRVGKLPRITCSKCRDAKGRVCDNHAKARCSTCGGWLTGAHTHLDYVGHADVTDRLVTVDPDWTWEPMAVGTDGLPLLDGNGGLWIRLTVAEVTKPGYGDADGKRGGNAVKEAIGDAIRNASMRFGVALDQWRKEPPDDTDQPRRRRASPRAAATARAEPSKVAADLFRQITEAATTEALDQVWQATVTANEHGDLTDAERRQLAGHARNRKKELTPVGER